MNHHRIRVNNLLRSIDLAGGQNAARSLYLG